MQSRAVRSVLNLELEEKFLNAGALLSMLAVFLPWVSGEWLGGESISTSGFGFYTGVLGIAVFLLNAFILSLTLVPLLGGAHVVPLRHRENVRAFMAVQATILLLAILSVLMRITFEFSRLEIRFGLYIALLGSIVSMIYALIRLHEMHRSAILHVARTDTPPQQERHDFVPPPPPPPPPAAAAEEHGRTMYP